MPHHRHHNRIYQHISEPPAGSIFAAYGRYSSEMQDAVTLVTQKEGILHRAQVKGWQVPQEFWFTEPETSAKYETIAARQQFQSLLHAAQQHRFAGVLVYDTSRWARNITAATQSLNILTALHCWWETSDGLWDIAKIQEQGFQVAFAVDMAINQSFLFALSKRIIDAKRSRAIAGYHNGDIPFGYRMPDYDPRPTNAPANWKPPRKPVRVDDDKRTIFVQIAAWRISGHSAREISLMLNDLHVRPSGSRVAWNKDAVTDLLSNTFYCEYAPGTGKGTITTPDGDLQVQGMHEALWDWDTWHKMQAVTERLRLSGSFVTGRKRAYPFAGLMSCAACGEPCTAWHSDRHQYYNCRAERLGKFCPSQRRSTNARLVDAAFGRILLEHRMGDTWRNDLVQLLQGDELTPARKSIGAARARIERQRRRLEADFDDGEVSLTVYRARKEELRREEMALPKEDDAVRALEAQVAAGAHMVQLAEAWMAATMDERRDITTTLIAPGGLIWDHEARRIIALRPYEEFLPSLQYASGWREAKGQLWSDTDPAANAPVLPIQRPRYSTDPLRNSHKAPPTPKRKLTAPEIDQVRDLVAHGATYRDVARQFGVSAQTIYRLSHGTDNKKAPQ